jgi:uncharacterized oxidoreductase
MNIQNKTILITGGGSGIGFEIARLMHAGNRVILLGRNQQKLEAAAAALPGVLTLQADITDEQDVDRIVATVQSTYSDLAVLINNAGHAYAYTLSASSDTHQKAMEEMASNYLAPIRLTEKLLPVLQQQPEAAVVNVSSIVALVPGNHVPTYSASKAALHAYTRSLRSALSADTAVKVFELMPPLVNTDFSVEIGGRERGMPPAEVAEALIKAMQEDVYEIHVGQTAQFYNGFFTGSAAAYSTMNP